jgi:uncharacterized protein YndB with AHSA1/START domain
MRFANTITIDRPVADVFAYLARFENLPKWNYAIGETRKISHGPVGVGSRYAQSRTLPTRSTETFEITAYEPDRTLAIDGTFGPFPGHVTYQLESVGSSTRLTNSMDLEPSGLLSIVAPLATSRIKAAVAANLGTLKQILEFPSDISDRNRSR